MLETFLENVLHPSHVPLYKEGTFGAYDPSRDWQTMSNRHKFTQDKILMLEYLPELITAAHCVPEYPVRDEFLRGMGELDKTREIPMYLAFAAQLFLDAHHILREKVLFGLDTCMWHMQLMHEDLDQHLEFHENLRINSWPASNDDVLRELQRRLMVCVSAVSQSVTAETTPFLTQACTLTFDVVEVDSGRPGIQSEGPSVSRQGGVGDVSPSHFEVFACALRSLALPLPSSIVQL